MRSLFLARIGFLGPDFEVEFFEEVDLDFETTSILSEDFLDFFEVEGGVGRGGGFEEKD